jgi:chaperone required for assembly of F1-ATPase
MLCEQMQEGQQFRARHDKKKTDHLTMMRQEWYQRMEVIPKHLLPVTRHERRR